MNERLLGIHHITALASDPQRNADFYIKVLGLRLVKKTVNFDAPDVYHLYYGDEVGHPGSILTFFPFSNAARGTRGNGQAITVSFSTPENALGYWIDRFMTHEVPFEAPKRRFNNEVVVFYDPDGLQLELVANKEALSRSPWTDGAVDPQFAIRGFYGVTLSESAFDRTSALLTDTLGFQFKREEGDIHQFTVGEGTEAAFVEVLCKPDLPQGRISAGSVHHVAWRVADDASQLKWRENILNHGYDITPVLDRRYFRSVYFREPGGVLFELATDQPGFAIDESIDELGTHLELPPWLERYRKRIEGQLPPVSIPFLKKERVGIEE